MIGIYLLTGLDDLYDVNINNKALIKFAYEQELNPKDIGTVLR